MSDSNYIKEKLEQIDNKLERIDSRLDDTKREMGEMGKTLIRHDENLKEHMRRSLLLEEQTELLRKDLRPLEKHVAIVNTFFKALGLIAAVTGAVVGVIKLFQ